MERLIKIIVLFITIVPVSLLGQQSNSLPPLPRYDCHYTDENIVVDGNITEPAWENAPRTERFLGLLKGGPVKYETYVKMLWNNQGIYVSFYVEEEDIRGVITSRDAFS